jgi:Tfp pilus assembly protein PilN
MKYDINLLQKRKSKQYSGKKVALLLLTLALAACAVYAGFMLPGKALSAVQLTAAQLDAELASGFGAEQDLASLTEEYATLRAQLDAMTALDAARADLNGYLDAIEASLPATANITWLSIRDRAISITGVAADDNTIAAFCVRLRGTGKFSYVFLQSSVAMETGESTFTLSVDLPFTLDSSGILPQATESPDAAPAESEDLTAIMGTAETGAGQ